MGNKLSSNRVMITTHPWIGREIEIRRRNMQKTALQSCRWPHLIGWRRKVHAKQSYRAGCNTDWKIKGQSKVEGRSKWCEIELQSKPKIWIQQSEMLHVMLCESGFWSLNYFVGVSWPQLSSDLVQPIDEVGFKEVKTGNLAPCRVAVAMVIITSLSCSFNCFPL